MGHAICSFAAVMGGRIVFLFNASWQRRFR
jgi:hypothetical protein